MTYTKPDVVVLGKAVFVIEGYVAKLWVGFIDNLVYFFRQPPAYDLDD